MAIEREYKLKLTDEQAATLRTWLESHTTFFRSEDQENTIFDNVKKSLKKSGTVLRHRRTEHGEELTAKGPQIAGIAGKAREEVNIQLAGGNLPQLLALLGYSPNAAYHKRTDIFEYRGALVSLDYLEGLGWFCEIETKKQDAPLEQIIVEIGLGGIPEETRSYVKLAAHAVREIKRTAAATTTSTSTH